MCLELLFSGVPLFVGVLEEVDLFEALFDGELIINFACQCKTTFGAR